MNEQEKALQGMIEFCQWLIPNAKQLGLEQSESIAMISRAQTQQDLMKGVDSLYQELGEEQFKALAQAFQKSKSQAVPMNKKGAKIDYLVDKFKNGGRTDKPSYSIKYEPGYRYNSDVVIPNLIEESITYPEGKYLRRPVSLIRQIQYRDTPDTLWIDTSMRPHTMVYRDDNGNLRKLGPLEVSPEAIMQNINEAIDRYKPIDWNYKK